MNIRSALCLLGLLGLLAACGDEPDPNPAVIPSTTKILDPAAQATLVSYSSADGTLIADLPSDLALLVPGDVVVSGVVAGIAPRGLLRKVTGSTQAGGQVIVTTATAGLVDAVDTGTLSATVTPTADMLDMAASTGDPSVTIGPVGSLRPGRNHITSPSAIRAAFHNTEIGGLTLNGDVAFDMHIDAVMVIRNFRLEHFRFIVRIDMDTDLTIDGSVNLPVPGVGGEAPLWTIYFTPIAFAIGPVPIVITPRLALAYGANISAQMTVAGLHLENSTTAQVGTDFTPATGWVDQSFGNGTGSTSIAAFPQIGLTFDTYARAELAFMLYDVIGPYVWTNQGLIFDLATPRDPFFRAGVHIRGGLGGRIDAAPGSILNLLDFSGAFLDVIGWFFASPNTPPFLTVANPLDGDYTQLGRFTPLSAAAFDLEDGPLAAVHWTSDRDGDLGTGNTVPAVPLWRTGPGVHTITASVTDSDGVTTNQVARVTVLNQAPDLTVVSPRGGELRYLGSTAPLIGGVTSPFVESGDACATPGWTFLWTSSSAPGDVITNGTSCSASVRFGGAAGPRTLTFRAYDPWPSPLGQSGIRTVIVNAQPRPSDVFETTWILSPAASATPHDADQNGVLPAPLTLTGLVDGPPTPVGTLTYIWTAVAYSAAGVPGPERAVGTGNNLSWQPASTPGLLDISLNQQRVDIILRVADAAGNHADETRPITIRFAPG